MGKKAKIGKQRRDKAYWSAKEIGFRSRASFKLVQLNRKFEFLQKSRVCLDLCAAPGSWMQVAKETMPVSSIIVGVDLVPIKPVPGCLSMVNDITTDKCRADIRRELQGWKADVVLHDGAPNVGKSWIHDAYQQSLLTLSAFKLATEFLKGGGTFVTKVFRSKDYQSLLWVFNQFFKKVHATKPPASRNESAEIFVVCLGYKDPDRIDPKFVDASYVFSEIDPISLPEDEVALSNVDKRKKAPAEGYETGATLLFKRTNASEFIIGDKPIHILNNSHEIYLDKDWILCHPKTTVEIKECLKDIKVLGMKELRIIKTWRGTLKSEYEKEQKEKEEQMETKNTSEEKDSEAEDDEELSKLESQISQLNEEERKGLRRKKKRELKEKNKRAEKINLKMIIPGDSGPKREEEGLFVMKTLKTKKDVENVEKEEENSIISESDSDDEPARAKRIKYSKYSGVLDQDGLYYKDSNDSELEEQDEWNDLDKEDLDLKEETIGPEMNDDELEKLNEPPSNPLLVDFENNDRDARRERKSSVWFDKDVFHNLDDENETLEEEDISNAIKTIKSRKGVIKERSQNLAKKRKASVSDEEDISDDEEEERESSSTDSDSDYDEVREQVRNGFHGSVASNTNEFEVVPLKQKSKKTVKLTPEELALGQQMIRSKKAKRDIIDAGWNRYMFPDKDEDLPDWFVKEEKYHMRKLYDVDPETLSFYNDKQKNVNVKTIKKVIEAKARKKRRMTKKLDRAKKRAAAILDNEDIGNREKAKEIQRMYNRIQHKEKEKKEVTYTVARKFCAAKRAQRPGGVKGLYKQVDPRMKKDSTLKRTKASGKRVQKRKFKGKQARPNAK